MLSLSSDLIPDEWRLVEVYLFSKRTPVEAYNYRSNSLTSIISKMFERIVRDSIIGHLYTQYILYEAQRNCLSRFSCLINLLITLITVTQRRDEVEAAEICFLDFSKAFNYAKYRFLWPIFVVDCIMSHQANRTFELRIENAVSEEAAVPNDVIQGSVIRFLLFLVTVNNFPDEPQLSSCFFCCKNKSERQKYRFVFDPTDLIKRLHRRSKTSRFLTQPRALPAFQTKSPTSLLFPNATDDAVPLSQFHCINDLELLVDCLRSHSPQIDTLLTKARGCLLSSGTFTINVIFLLLHNATSSPRLLSAVVGPCPHTRHCQVDKGLGGGH